MDVQISLVGRTGRTGEIRRQLRAAILDGRLRAGDRLPPSRELAERLEVARATVVTAYDQLAGEGLVTSRRGSGTFVNELTLPRLRAGHSTASQRPDTLRARAVWDHIHVTDVFDRPAELDFRTGLADASLFPLQAWRRLSAETTSAPSLGKAMYGNPAGHEGLRAGLARHLGLSRSLDLAPEDILITSGAQQAIDLVARVLMSPGDVVAVEDPGYPPPWRLFRSLGLEVRGVPVDDEGIVVDRIPPGTRLVCVTPSHQYPLGSVMSLSRRLALLEWARANDAAILEDDYDSEFRFRGRPLEPLRSLDLDGRVIFVGSMSKTLLPVLRIGFVVVPPSLRDAAAAAKWVTDWHTSLPTQATLARFIEDGLLAGHIRRLRPVDQRRHDLIEATLVDRFGEHLEVIPSEAGIHLAAVATRADHDAIDTLVETAATKGVGLHPLSMCDLDGGAPPGLLFGYGAIATDAIPEGLDRLLRAFASSPTIGG